jgi:hypothetical protein
MDGQFVRVDHSHRFWEYANVVLQLRELGVSLDSHIHDAGSGGSFLPLFLKVCKGYRQVSVSDSMAYGDYTPHLIDQCRHLGIEIPLYVAPVERLLSVTGGQAFDVTLCISTIEHVASELFLDALRELALVTKPGGYVMITSDFFSDLEAAELSPFKTIQHTKFTPTLASKIPELSEDLLEFVGEQGFSYRGDFVNNYSFVNMCLRRTPITAGSIQT